MQRPLNSSEPKLEVNGTKIESSFIKYAKSWREQFNSWIPVLILLFFVGVMGSALFYGAWHLFFPEKPATPVNKYPVLSLGEVRTLQAKCESLDLHPSIYYWKDLQTNNVSGVQCFYNESLDGASHDAKSL